MAGEILSGKGLQNIYYSHNPVFCPAAFLGREDPIGQSIH
jgi:hypothetical protein